MANSSLSLLSNMNRVEVPFIKVTIGKYVFGVYDDVAKKVLSSQEKIVVSKYPNYVKQLQITKINGQVNKYVLTLEYTINETTDPNFFEKVFSSVSSSRSIIFSYGDLSTPYYCYRDEKAIITDIKSNISVDSSKITYTVYATSSTSVLSSAVSTFRRRANTKPSDVIKELVSSDIFGLLEVFYGMRNGLSINGVNLIPSNDMPKNIEAKENMSVLEYLKYLVSEMTPANIDGILKGNIYLLKFSDDISNELNGPYFQIVQSSNNVNTSEAYNIDIGYESKDIVMDFSIDDDSNYALYYNYCNTLEDTQYIKRYNTRGELETVYAPILSSGNAMHKTQEDDKTWWTKMTAYPISASITLKGLLRPATLVSNVRINVYFYGQKHTSSGLYIVTKEEDTISESGFRTKLNLVRIDGDKSYIYEGE